MITNLIITAYCSCRICCGPHAHNIAANNRPPISGITVAGPRTIPLGTYIKIDGYTNDFIINDRYNKHLSDRIDIYMSSHKAAKEFGVKHNVRVTIKEDK